MKCPVLILLLVLVSLSSSAQIERVPVTDKKDTNLIPKDTNIIPFIGSRVTIDKQSRKERFKELDLTREQKGKLKEINQSGKAAKEAIENNTSLSEDEKKKQLRSLQKAQVEKIQAILTPEQFEKFKASRQNNP